jgi:hypothetical protein
MDNFKFELIRANAAQEIMYCMNAKFQAATAQGLVDAFVDFASGCGYQKEDLKDAFELHIEEDLLYTIKEHPSND